MVQRTLRYLLNRPDVFPGGPDPGLDGALFLGWLKKRGAIRKKKDCERKCQENGFTARDFIKRMGIERIRIGETGNGNGVIKLVDTPWADQWMTYYDVEVPHHRHWKRL
jgi:hypothetical protein